MSISWKKLFVKLSDLIIFVYLVTVFVSLGNSSNGDMLCKGVDIEMSNGCTEGFLDKTRIKDIMKDNGVYPESSVMKNISTYQIEKVIRKNPYVKSVNCYKTHTGRLKVCVDQRIPAFMAVSSESGRFFMDKAGNLMPESTTAPYVMVVTGVFSREFASSYLVPVVAYINSSKFWHSQIEQVNVLKGGGIELIPRVGNHTVYLGHLPVPTNKEKQISDINKFMEKKLTRLFKFYKYGLSKVGWNKYSYINIEFDNQIICKKNKI